VGGGVEYAITPRWSLRGEVLHYDFGGDVTFVGAHNPTFIAGAAGRFTYNRGADDVGRVGLSYQIGSIYHALK
jgi:opacity protein-like surface antigen